MAQKIHISAATGDHSELDETNRRAFEEAYQLHKLAWADEPFRFQGKFYEYPYPYETGTPWPAHGWTREYGAPGEVDAQGRIRHHHFGEGEYEQSEATIQRLLAEAGVRGIPPEPVSVDARGAEAAADWGSLKSPENYVGHERTANFASPGGAVLDTRRVYTVPARLRLNQWALSGDWTVQKHATVLNAPTGRIACRFHARDLHLVMGPAARGRPVRFRVLIDGQPPGSARGIDVDDRGNGTVNEQRLYQLIRQPQPIGDRLFEIEFLESGVEAFAFTFG